MKTSPWAIVWNFLCDSAFSHFDTIPVCDGQTDTQTDRWMNTRQWLMLR